jgi:hypothetical protein
LEALKELNDALKELNTLAQGAPLGQEYFMILALKELDILAQGIALIALKGL